MRFADVLPGRWQEPGPHPVNPVRDYRKPGHHTTRAFYDRLPLITLEHALLYVAEHPGYRLRQDHGGWRAVR